MKNRNITDAGIFFYKNSGLYKQKVEKNKKKFDKKKERQKFKNCSGNGESHFHFLVIF